MAILPKPWRRCRSRRTWPGKPVTSAFKRATWPISVRALPDRSQQLLHPALDESLAAALAAWDAGRPTEARYLLQRALVAAQEMHLSWYFFLTPPIKRLLNASFAIIAAPGCEARTMTAVPRETRLFTLRMWQEAVDGDQAAFEWRGKVRALPEGEAYYFRDWSGLIAHLEGMLNAGRTAEPDPGLPTGLWPFYVE
jgi:hypothetical protein